MRALFLVVVVLGLTGCDCIGDGAGTAVLFVDNRASVAVRVVADTSQDGAIDVDVGAGERVELAEGSDVGSNPGPVSVLNDVHLFAAGSDVEVADFDGLAPDAWTAGPLVPFEGICASRYGVREWDLAVDDDDLAGG